MKAILILAFCCEAAFEEAVQGSTTPNHQVTLTLINDTFLESDIYLPYGNYGRIRIYNMEICSDDSSVTKYIGEALCRSKGLDVGVIGRDRLNTDHYNTLEIGCSSPNISECRVTRHIRHCSHVVYLYCDDKRTVHSSHVPVSNTLSHTTRTTTNGITRKLVSYDVRFIFTQAGRVKVRGKQICFDTFTTTAGEALCSAKGFIYSSHESALVYLTVPYVDISCSAPDLANCSLKAPKTYCRNVVYIHCSTHTTPKPKLESTTLTSGSKITSLTTPVHGVTFGVSSIFFAFKYGGRVKINTVEICYDTFTRKAGEALCQAKGLHYSSYSKGFAYSRYHTERIYCRSNSLSSCYTFSHICIEVVNIHCKGPVMTTPRIGCHNNPCQNGGSCHQNTPYEAYYCTCLDGYSGESCENSTVFEPEDIVTVGCLDDAWNITLYLPTIRNEYPDLKVGDFYIGQDNENCTGNVNGNYLIFTKEFAECQTKEMNTTEGINYQNVLVYALHDKLHHFIVREYRFRLKINCTKVFPNGPFSNNASSSIHFNQPLRVQFFSDPSYLHVKTLNSSKVGEKVYVRAYNDDVDRHSKMRLSDCYTTPSLSTDPNMNYFIIRNGCAIDPNAILLSQSAKETRFSFQYFEYATNEGSVKLHCTATVCHLNDLSPACATKCHNTMKKVEKLLFDETFVEK